MNIKTTLIVAASAAVVAIGAFVVWRLYFKPEADFGAPTFKRQTA